MLSDQSGDMVLVGLQDGGVGVVDMRSNKVEYELVGHSQAVKALLLSKNAGLVVSGSADNTCRVWDVRQRRVQHTMAMHTDSIRCLDSVSDDLRFVYSGGRDGCVYKTDIVDLVSELVVREDVPLTCLKVDAHSPDGTALWIGSEKSTVHCYMDGDTAASATRAAFSVGSVPSLRLRRKFKSTGDTHPASRCTSPIIEIPGAPSVVELRTMTDKRHIIAGDSEGAVTIWDVSQACIVESLGPAKISDIERSTFDPTQSALTWFQPDYSLGVLAGRMDPSSCFSCEEYLKHLGYPEAPPDQKVNMAAEMLKALFHQWKKCHVSSSNMSEQQDMFLIDSDEEPREASAITESVFKFDAEYCPAVMVSGDKNSPPWKKRCSEMDGTENIPRWVYDCIMRNEYPASKQLKMSFVLCPNQGSSLPHIRKKKLTAPRVLEVEKIVDYVVKDMETDHNLKIEKQPIFWSAEKQRQWDREHGTDTTSMVHYSERPPSQQPSSSGSSLSQFSQILKPKKTTQSEEQMSLVLTCNGMVIPWDFTLAAVRQWMWKRPEDLKIEYSIRHSNSDFRIPKIKIPNNI